LRLGGPAERRAALGLLGSASDAGTAELLADQVRALGAGGLEPELALDLVRAAEARGLRANSEQGTEPDELLAYYRHSLAGGDREVGRRVFMEKTELACRRCHPTEADGSARVGPDLTGLGNRLSVQQILESLIMPNASIADGYDSIVLSLDDGSYLAGRVLEESEDNLVLIDSEGELFDVAPAEITGRAVGLSAMPDGHAEHLNRREMRDLIEYLKNL
jgi:quinoprotein glucose dehydrogenase